MFCFRVYPLCEYTVWFWVCFECQVRPLNAMVLFNYCFEQTNDDDGDDDYSYEINE